MTIASAPALEPRESSDKIAPRVHQATLENGMTVLVLPVTKAPVVTLQLWYRVGSRNEILGRTGISHVLEHLMFKGTDKLGPEEFSQVIQENGGETNAFTSTDYTTYFETLASDRLGVALRLEADRMQHLKLAKETFEPERMVVMEERRLRSVDNPWGALYEETFAGAFRAHPYMWPIIGWMHDIESIDLDDVKHHYGIYYRPNNVILSIAGKVDPQKTIDEVREIFGSIPSGPQPPAVTPIEPQQLGERRVFVKKEANLPAFVWGYKVPNVNHEDAFALEVLSTLLSSGDSSRLYKSLVIDKRLVLDIGADYPLLSIDPGLFTLSAQVLPEKTVEEAEQALTAELKKLVDAPVGERELLKAKNQIEAEFVFAQDSNFYQAMLLARFELVGGWKKIDEYLPGIRGVGAADLQRVVKEYLVPDRRTVGVLVPTGAPAKPQAPLPQGMLH
ncbi:MAG: zinc protease [Candidatus Binatota bacterium]|nr:zinc protease [Candidatus Binatota bacterium]